MKTFFLLAFCALFCETALSQKEVSIMGTITDEYNAPLPYIDVLLKTNDSLPLVVAFAITDDYGRFKIIHQTKSNGLLLETSSLVHETVTREIKIDKKTVHLVLNLQLKERLEELDEIEVTATPRVIVRNDTTIFNVEKLTNGTERVVEEILRKLPGVVIDDYGRLKFKGKEVKNVLLDGDNLFGGNYTIGTKRINASHIKGIEAIENFEENSLLQGLSENDEVALNLKFGEGVSLSGDAELTYANGNRFSTNTTGIEVSQRFKGFATFSFNTIGNNLNDANFDATGFLDKVREQHSNGLAAPSYIGSNNSLLPNNNSTSNNELFGSLNLLPKLSDTETLRLNIDALSDRSLERTTSLTLIGNRTENQVRIEEANSNLIKPLYFNSSIFFQKFSSVDNSWSTNFKFSKLKNERQLLGILNDEEQGENTLFKELYLYNNTSYTHRIDDRSAIKVDGLAVFSEKPERLTLFSGIDFSTNTPIEDTYNTQTVYSKKQQVQIINNYFRKFGRMDKFNLKLNLMYFDNSLSSRLTHTNDSTAFENGIDYKVFFPEIATDYFFKKKNLSIRPMLKAKVYSYSYNDKLVYATHNDSEILIDASIRLKYELNNKNYISSQLEHLNEIPKEENLYTNFILRSNRILENNILNFDKRTSNTFNLYYRYDDLVKNTNIGLGFRFEKEDNSYLSSNNINNYIAVVTNILQDNGSENRILDFSFLKYVSALRSTIRLTTFYNNSNYYNFFNESDLRYNKSELLNATLGVGTSFIGKFLFANNFTYTTTDYSGQGFVGFKNQEIKNKFEITYVPSDYFRVNTSAEYLIPNVHDSGNRTLMLNTSVTYQNKKRTISYIMEGRNLLNQTLVGNIKNTDFSTKITSESLFDRLILLTINFKY